MGRASSADLILVNGNVLAFDQALAGSRAPTAVVVSNGLIEFVGDDETALSRRAGQTQVIELQGQTLMPGFIESHAHPSLYGMNLLELDCRPAATGSVDAIQQVVAAAASGTDAGGWIRGWGWDDSRMVEKRNPTRADLDAVAPDHPVMLRRTCGHMAVINSKALELAGIDANTPDPPGGHIQHNEHGEPTGLMQETAQGLAAPPEYGPDDIVAGLRLAQQDFLRWGVTTVHDMSARGPEMRAYQQLLADGDLRIRLRPWLWALDGNGWEGILAETLRVGISSGLGNDMLRIQGMKFMLDGSVGGRTAAVADPFEDSSSRGILTMEPNDVAGPVAQALAAGLRVAIHGIGERAIDVAIGAIKNAGNRARVPEVKPMRNRIEHCALPTEQNLGDMRELGLIAASSIGFLYSLGDSYLANLGPERMKRVYPHRTFKEHGIVAPGNSDAPVTDGNPWLGIYAAVNRTSSSGKVLDEVQNVPVADALSSYTNDAAYASFEEDRLGCLRPGAIADMIVLRDNPLEVEPELLKDMTVEQTYLAGQLVYTVSA
ncbi:amidohydrolase [Arthrobacter pigmenti]